MSGTAPLVPPALRALQAQLLAGEAPRAADLAAIAAWRLACGDGLSAARWRRWSLEPPPPERLREALCDLWLLLGMAEPAEALGGGEGWQGVQLALALQQPDRALQLQQQAVAAQQPIDANGRLRLASLWKQRGQPQPALELLLGIPQAQGSASLCNLIAVLHEQNSNAAQAARWWECSLSLDPNQLAVLSHRARNALHLGEHPRACHVAQTLLERDPLHPTGQSVLQASLEHLGAKASLRQLLAQRLQLQRAGGAPAAQPQELAGQLKRWWQPRRRRQRAWRRRLAPELRDQPWLLVSPPRPLPP